MQLSRLGVDTLAAQGRDWQAFPKGDPAAPNYFAETGQAIAPQFWGFWSSNGLEFDGNKKAKSFQESLRCCIANLAAADGAELRWPDVPDAVVRAGALRAPP